MTRLLALGGLACLLIVGAWACGSEANAGEEASERSAAAGPADSQKELDAIQRLIDRNIELTNMGSRKGLSLEERIALGAETHRPDSSYAPGELPMYFATNTVPIIRGSEAYIRASELEVEAYRKAGYRFEVQPLERQIYLEGNMALALVTTTGVIIAPGDKILGGQPGRWTLGLQKATDGKWYIFHEHLSFFNYDGQDPDDQIRNLERAVGEAAS